MKIKRKLFSKKKDHEKEIGVASLGTGAATYGVSKMAKKRKDKE